MKKILIFLLFVFVSCKTTEKTNTYKNEKQKDDKIDVKKQSSDLHKGIVFKKREENKSDQLKERSIKSQNYKEDKKSDTTGNLEEELTNKQRAIADFDKIINIFKTVKTNSIDVKDTLNQYIEFYKDLKNGILNNIDENQAYVNDIDSIEYLIERLQELLENKTIKTTKELNNIVYS